MRPSRAVRSGEQPCLLAGPPSHIPVFLRILVSLLPVAMWTCEIVWFGRAHIVK